MRAPNHHPVDRNKQPEQTDVCRITTAPFPLGSTSTVLPRSHDNMKNDPKHAPALLLAAPHHLERPSGDDVMQPRPRAEINDHDIAANSSPGANASSPRSDPTVRTTTPAPTGGSRRRTAIRDKQSQAAFLQFGDSDSSQHLSQKMRSRTRKRLVNDKAAPLKEEVVSSSSAMIMMSPLNTTPGAVAIPGIMTTNNSAPTTMNILNTLPPERQDTFLLPAAIQIVTSYDEEEQRTVQTTTTTTSMVDRMGEKIKEEVQAQLAAAQQPHHHAPYVVAEAVAQKSTRTSNQSSVSFSQQPHEQETQSCGPCKRNSSTYSCRMISSIIIAVILLAGIVTGVVLASSNRENKSTTVDPSR